MAIEIFNFIKKFQLFADGGPRRKIVKFSQIEKKFKFQTTSVFQIANVIFLKIYNESENIFRLITQM